MERFKNLEVLFFSMSWTILFGALFCFSTHASDQTQSSTSTSTRIPTYRKIETSKNWNGFRIRIRESKEETTLQPLHGRGETFSLDVSDQTQSSSTSSTLQPLPLKDDTFHKIRKGNKVFIDKTPYIEQLLNDGRNLCTCHPSSPIRQK